MNLRRRNNTNVYLKKLLDEPNEDKIMGAGWFGLFGKSDKISPSSDDAAPPSTVPSVDDAPVAQAPPVGNITAFQTLLQNQIDIENTSNLENGFAYSYPIMTLLKQINIFTNKWNSPQNNATNFECDESKIQGDNVDITMNYNIQSFLKNAANVGSNTPDNAAQANA